jgi:hypothetical protein
MPDLKAISLALLSNTTGINGQTLTKQTLYSVPTGFSMIPVVIVLYGPSATLAGLVSMSFGGDAGASDWLGSSPVISLAAITATTDCMYVFQADPSGSPLVPTKKSIYAAGTAFGLKINTGSSGAATFKAALFGFIF